MSGLNRDVVFGLALSVISVKQARPKRFWFNVATYFVPAPFGIVWAAIHFR